MDGGPIFLEVNSSSCSGIVVGFFSEKKEVRGKRDTSKKVQNKRVKSKRLPMTWCSYEHKKHPFSFLVTQSNDNEFTQNFQQLQPKEFKFRICE